MDLKKIIVHELKKEAGKENTTVIASEELLPIDQESIELVNSLLNSYKNDNLLNAQFDRTPGKYFPERFDAYRETTRTDEEFKKFTVEAIGNLATIIKRKIAAKGGYVVFCEYRFNGLNFISIFLIRDVEGKILKRDGNSFSIGRIEYLDTNHLAMACRINENLLDTEQNYLTFTRLRQQDVSDYFVDWICALQLKSSAEFTQALYNIINRLDLPINEETGQRYSIDEVRDKVYETARINTRREINISTVSDQIYGDPQRIRNYAEENNISIDTEFRYDKRVLKRFIQLNIQKDGINIKFSRGDLGTKIWPSQEDPNLVIIESEALATALRAEQ